MFTALIVLGLLLIAVTAVLVLMAWGGMSRRMPTRVPPPRIARYTLACAVVLIAVGVVGSLFPSG